MPNSYRIVTQIQDQDDFAGSLTNDYYLKYSSGTGKFSLQPLSVSPGGSDGQVQYNNAGSFGGAALVTYATSGTILTAAAGATTDVPLVVKAAASQTANLQQWQNSSGTAQASIAKDGALTLGTAGVAPSLAYTLAAQGSSGVVFIRNSGNQICFNTANFGANIAGSIQASTITFTDYFNTMFKVDCTTGHTSIGTTTDAAQLLTSCNASSTIGLIVRGTTSQSAPLLQLQGTSSTTAGTAQAEIDTVWVDSTHATRKARLLLRAYDTAVREGLRIDADGSYALTAIGGGTVTASTALTVTSPTATYIGQIVKGASSQSANLQEWQNSSGTILSGVDSSGCFMAPVGSKTAPGYQFSGISSTGIFAISQNVLVSSNNANCVLFNTAAVRMSSGISLSWSSGDTGVFGADTGLARSAAGIVTITNGSTGVGSLELGSGGNIILSTTTGTKIGTGTTQLLGFYNATPVDQPATVTDPTGGATVDAEARAAIIAVIDRLQELGLIA